MRAPTIRPEAAFGSQTALQSLINRIGHQSDIRIVPLNETIIMLVFLPRAVAVACTDKLLTSNQKSH